MGWSQPLIALALLGLARPVHAESLLEVELHLRQLAEEAAAVDAVELALKADALELRVQIGAGYWRDHELVPEVEGFIEIAYAALLVQRPENVRVDVYVREKVGAPWRAPPRRTRGKNSPPKQNAVVPDPARFPYGTALAGKTIAISPGHGYIYYSSLGAYSTQRSNLKWDGCGECRGIVEDFGSHEIAIQHLIPLLEGAGARVVLVRDRSYGAAGSLVDTSDPAYAEVSGGFQAGASEGGFGGNYRYSSSSDARADYRFTAPLSGPQALSLWFVQGSNRLADVLVEIQAPGGIRRHRLDQRTIGRRFVPIDLLDVPLGTQIDVSLSASGGTGVLVSDAVRLGAGRHSSGHAWWSMGAAPFAAYQEAPDSVLSFGDVSIRPAYAEWYGADAYVSIHSNASGQANSTAAGTVTYRFNCLQYADHSADPPAASCDDPVGSDRLQETVHQEMIREIKRDWDPNWVDRGTRVANFGELRELAVIPGILIETAFHDNLQLASGSTLRATDNQSLHDPRLRRPLAQGIYRGLTRFLAGEGPYSLPPPSKLVAKRVDATTLELDFEPVSGARGYRVYQAIGHRNFDQGRLIEQRPYRAEGLVPDAPVFFKVSTLNEAGEGLVSRVVGAKPSSRRAQILLIDTFDREDAWVQTQDNQKNTLLVHGLALANAPFAFDGTDEAAWAAGGASVAEYDAVVLAFGRESTEHSIATVELREALRSFAAGGGAIFASGSEIGWTLDQRGDAASRAFLQGTFGVRLAKDDAAATQVRSNPAGLLSSAVATPVTLDDGSSGGLKTYSSDAFGLEAGATAELYYGSETDVAAVALGKNLLLGVALDSFVGPSARSAVLSTWAEAHLDVIPVVPGADAGPLPTDGGTPDLAEAGDGGVAPSADAGTPVGPDGAEIDGGRSPGIKLFATTPNPIEGGCQSVGPGDVSASLWLFGALWLARRRRHSSSSKR